MPQIIQERGLGQTLGTALGTGISGGLQNLLTNKLQQMQQNKQASAFQQAFPQLPPQIGELLALQPDLAKTILDRLEGLEIGASGTPEQKTSGITLGPSSQERRHRETLSQQKELSGIKTAQPKFLKIEEEAKPARQLTKLATDALNLLKTGKALTGLKGQITPTYLQTPQGQELTALLDQIVLQKAQLGKGVPSRIRLELEKGAKAAIWQQPEVIESILTDIIEDPENIKAIARNQALEELMGEHGENFHDISQVNKRAQQIVKENIKKTLPDPKDLQEGTTADNGKEKFIVRNGKWEEE